MERPRLANLARWTDLVCSASMLLFLKVMVHWVHPTVWSTTEMLMLMFCMLKGALPLAPDWAGGGGRRGLITLPL